MIRSEEWRRKQSEAQRGKPKPVRSAEHRANLSAANRGKKPSRQAIEAIIRANTGRPAHPNQIASVRGNHFALAATVIGECVYCWGPATLRDHVVPKRRGGVDEASNMVLCCLRCNSSKNYRTPEEWLADGLYGRGSK